MDNRYLSEYRVAIERKLNTRVAAEQAYCLALRNMLKSVPEGRIAANAPKRIEAGQPPLAVPPHGLLGGNLARTRQ